MKFPYRQFAIPIIVTIIVTIILFDILSDANGQQQQQQQLQQHLQQQRDTWIEALLSVEREGEGHESAVTAAKHLRLASSDTLLPLLHAMNRANPLAANWIRGTFAAVADRQLGRGAALPVADLKRFATDRSHAPQSRELAYEWLMRVDPAVKDELIGKMLDDPATAFRRLAVAELLLTAANTNDATDQKEIYRRAFAAARDPDQLDDAFDKLKELGEEPDLLRQLGLINSWWLLGPFDHRDGIGFDAVYPPEQGVALDAEYTGKNGKIRWQEQQSVHRHATLDLNPLFANEKGAVMYAFCQFASDEDQQVEIRVGTPNGWKLWVNGELLYAHEEYHMGMRMDQYPIPAQLKAGMNQILLKICQNEQTEDWAQRWEFQVRVCDTAGAAVLPAANR